MPTHSFLPYIPLVVSRPAVQFLLLAAVLLGLGLLLHGSAAAAAFTMALFSLVGAYALQLLRLWAATYPGGE